MNGLIARKKKYRFQVEARVQELQHVPFVNQVLFAKIRLIDGGFTDRSPRMSVQDHSVRWDAHFTFPCKMTANASTGELDSCICRISVRQELRGGRSFQKLGYADVNLAEFPGCGGWRVYLLKGYESKSRLHNSTLKVRVDMTLLAGDPCFKAKQPETSDLAASDGADVRLEVIGSPSRIASGSLPSLSSSGYDSLTKRFKEALGDGEEEAWSGDIPGHSRNSSNTSHGSHGSGYASINSHSDKSGHLSSSTGSGGLSEAGSLERHPVSSRGKSLSGEVIKESRVEATRVDHNDIINQIFENSKIEALKPDDASDTPGLQLYIGKDGTATFGGRSLKQSKEYEAVVINKR